MGAGHPSEFSSLSPAGRMLQMIRIHTYMHSKAQTMHVLTNEAALGLNVGVIDDGLLRGKYPHPIPSCTPPTSTKSQKWLKLNVISLDVLR